MWPDDPFFFFFLIFGFVVWGGGGGGGGGMVLITIHCVGCASIQVVSGMVVWQESGVSKSDPAHVKVFVHNHFLGILILTHLQDKVYIAGGTEIILLPVL